MTRIAGTLHEDQYTFLVISRSFRLRMRNSSDKVAEYVKTHILCVQFIFSFQNRPLNEIMWENIAQPGRPQMMMIIIIIIIIIINCNWVVSRWQWLFYMYTNYLLLLVFSPWAGLGRDQSSVRRLVWLWYAASWASS